VWCGRVCVDEIQNGRRSPFCGKRTLREGKLKKILLMMLLASSPAWADAPWSAQEARDNAQILIGKVIEGQKLLKYAVQTKDSQGWNGFIEQQLMPIAEAFRAQRMGLNNKNVEIYEDCEEALADYWSYSNTLFKKGGMTTISVRDGSEKDFKEYFKSCKKNAGWHGS
jgi:hypothetical protein